MRKNRHLAIYPQLQFHDIIFSSKYLFCYSQKLISFEAAVSLYYLFIYFIPHSILGLAMWKILSSNDVEVIA